MQLSPCVRQDEYFVHGVLLKQGKGPTGYVGVYSLTRALVSRGRRKGNCFVNTQFRSQEATLISSIHLFPVKFPVSIIVLAC